MRSGTIDGVIIHKSVPNQQIYHRNSNELQLTSARPTWMWTQPCKCIHVDFCEERFTNERADENQDIGFPMGFGDYTDLLWWSVNN